MRIAELSRTSGVPVPSIKYYLRAGLLPPGERTAPNQADYGQAHVQRLRLIRALIEVGGLPVAAIGDVLAAIGSPGIDIHQAMGTALAAAIPAKNPETSPEFEAAYADATELIESQGWRIDLDSPKVGSLAQALAVYYRLGKPDEIKELIGMYVETTQKLGTREVEWAASRSDREAIVEAAIVGTFVGGAVLNALRTIVHEDASKRLLEGTNGPIAPQADPDHDATA